MISDLKKARGVTRSLITWLRKAKRDGPPEQRHVIDLRIDAANALVHALTRDMNELRAFNAQALLDRQASEHNEPGAAP